MKRFFLLSIFLILLSFAAADAVEAYCGSSGVTYIDVYYDGFKTCPITANAGDSLTVWIKYIDAGEGSVYKYDHRSLWRGTTRVGCNYSQGSDDCGEKWDSFAVTLPTTPGTYTYTAKAYAASSQSSTYCNSSEDGTQSCTITVVAPCQCSSGVCCDGCNYYGTSRECNWEDEIDYGCPWGTGCGADVGWRVRSRTQYCSGTSASCTGSWSTWSAWSSWYTEDYCGTSEYCTDDDSTCNTQCSSGACCDGCRYKTYGSQPTGYTDDANGFCSGTNGPNTTSYVYTRDYYCNGTDASMHYTDTLQDTCGTCEYCTDNDLTCNTYSDGTVCDTGKTCQGGSCLATCSSLSYPTDKWQRVWYDWSTNCLGDGPDEPNATFDTNWGTGVIAYGLSDYVQFYSSRKIYLSTGGIWRFTLGSDDGSRLYVDGVLRIDNWTSGSYRQRTVSLDLAAGWHNFEIDYYEAGTSARVSFTYNYDAESAACNTECVRRGYLGGECYTTAYPPPPFTTPFCSGYTFADLIPDQGACSGATLGCTCCHNCPSSPPGDNVSVGSCSVNITGTGWDYTDGSSVGFHELDKDTNWRSYWMCDAPSGSICASNLQIKNSWPSVSGDQITVRTDILAKSASHDLGAGFTFNGGSCKYTVNLVGTTESSANIIGDELGACETGTHTFGMTRDANTGNYLAWMMDMEYCGDGECNCGETCTSCQTDCGSCDAIDPTTVIEVERKSNSEDVTSKYLRADTYTIQFQDSDNVGGSGLKECKYYIRSCDINGENCTSDVVSFRTRICNTPLDISVGAYPYNLDYGYRYLIYSEVTDNANNWDYAFQYLRTDFTIPTTEIR